MIEGARWFTLFIVRYPFCVMMLSLCSNMPEATAVKMHKGITIWTYVQGSLLCHAPSVDLAVVAKSFLHFHKLYLTHIAVWRASQVVR